MSDKVVDDLLLEMEHIHLLSLADCTKITKVPTSIGNLIYLRYLNLSCTYIVSLPSETCKLVNLQTLLVSNCTILVELPEDVGKLVSLRNLNVEGTSLKEMPVQIGKLKTLENLSNFIVSKQCGGLKVGELGKLPHLRGNLSISGLQNVIDPSEASQANLVMKKQIEELKLKWDHPSPSDSDSQIQSGVLDRLRPSTNSKSLTLEGYGGTNFPNWLGDSSFGNMVYLKINNCDNCSQLPPLGQLGKLKELFIKGMKSLKSVGDEFYGNGGGSSFQPFPSLETLSFKDMQEWEEWNLIGGTTTKFPVLRCLTLKGCPKLKGNIPTNLPSLTKLELGRCPLLVEPWNSDDNSNMLSSEEEEKYYEIECTTPKELEFSFHNYTSLESLKIQKSCYSMTSFTLDTFPLLKKLYIWDCEKLKTIVIVSQQQQSLSSLTYIEICDCDEVESISFGGIGLGFSIPNLGRLNVYNCKKLRSLLEPMKTLVGLRDMYITNLPNLQSIGKDGFPINLRELRIGSCDTVEAVMKMKVGLLPTSLERLVIGRLGDIEHLDGKWLQHLTSLQQLHISNAPNLASLPDEGFPASLSKLYINDCPLLEERLKDKKGKDWTNIAHIPTILINGERIKDE